MARKRTSSIENPRMAKRRSQSEVMKIRRFHAKQASKATGKPVSYFMKMYSGK